MIALIVAATKDGIIGANGNIPWHIAGEQSQFKELTIGNTIILGKNAYDEIVNKWGNPLKHRDTIVVQSQSYTICETEDMKVWAERTLREAIQLADKKKDIFISGGAMTYASAIDLDIIDRIYFTSINNFMVDSLSNLVYMPDMHLDRYELASKVDYNIGTPNSFTRYIYNKK